MPSVKKCSHSSLCYTTTDGEFFPLCALLSIYAKAFLARARWNHHHDERAWEEGCCTGLPEHHGSWRADEHNKQNQPTAKSGAQNLSGLQGTEWWLQQQSWRRRLCIFVQYSMQPWLQSWPSCWLLRMALASNHCVVTARWVSDTEEKSEGSTVASVEMSQLSMKAWCALN